MNSFLLHHLLMESAENFPDNIAVVINDKTIDYKTLERKSDQLSTMLSRAGVRQGQRVGIILKKSIESIISIFGILKAGAVYVPIDPFIPQERINFIIKNCDIRCLLTSRDRLKKINTQDHPAIQHIVLAHDRQANDSLPDGVEIHYWDELEDVPGTPLKDPDICDQSPAYILYTSGSTGVPKGVTFSHLNSLTFVNTAADFFNIQPEDRLASHAPLHFDLSIFDIFAAIKTGAAIVLIPEFFSTFPKKISEYIVKKDISIWNGVATSLVIMATRGNIENFNFSSLRLILFSGDIMPVKYLRKLKEHIPSADFYNIYGQSEANSSLYYKIDRIDAEDSWKIPIGKPFPNFEVFALNDEGHTVRHPGEKGELYIKGSTVALGYWRNTEKTRDHFVADPMQESGGARVFRTGDIVKLDNDCNYVFIGRKDSIVKSRGYRIELDEIEAVLNSHSLVNQAVAVSIPDDMFGNRIIACVSPYNENELDSNTITEYCSKTLPKYMIPERIRIMDQLPETSTGKIDRNILRDEVAGVAP
ncbi:MAG: amino acid adenylation domain-containing protein [Desulfobacter sp.]